MTMLRQSLFLFALHFSFLGAAQAQGLSHAIDAASQVDPALRSSALNRLAQQEGIEVARSRLFPQLSMQGGVQQLTQTTTQDNSNPATTQSYTVPSSNHQLMLRQALIRPRELGAVRQAQSLAEHSEFKLQIDRNDLWSRTSMAWLEWLGARQMVKIQQAPLQTLKAWVEQEQKRLDQGDGTRDSLMEAQAQWANAQSLYAEALLNQAAREAALRLLTQAQVQAFAAATWPERLPWASKFVDFPELWQKVLHTSAELRAAFEMEKVHRERHNMAKMEHLPTLDLVAVANRAMNEANRSQGYRYQNHQVGVQYAIPIFAGGGTTAAERQAFALYQASVADREALQMRLETELHLASNAVASGQDRLQAGEELLNSAREQRKAAERGMVHGVKTWGDRAQAELNHSRRSADHVNLMLAALKAQLRVLRLLPTSDPLWEQWVQSLQ